MILVPKGCLCCSIYVECVDGTGILEWDTVAERLVKFMANETGYISVYPASDKIIVIDYDMPTVNVLRPQSEALTAVLVRMAPTCLIGRLRLSRQRGASRGAVHH